ncbi:MAG TPA: hypothetical protein VFH99_03110 [Candidatus Saccharimonadales bacterium]|nr:hypothetical protein [Candidatus Saccharimonadales bacterium]
MAESPVPWGGGPPLQVARAARAQEKTELAIYSHHLEMEYLRQCDTIDSAAIADVARTALEEEMRVLDEGLALAGDSLAKRELVSRMVSIQSKIDSARIVRRFGE